MLIETDEELDARLDGKLAIVAKMFENAAGGHPGFPIYEERYGKPGFEPGFDYVPFCCWFYYIRIDTDGKLRIDHYFDTNGNDLTDPQSCKPITQSELPAIIERLARNARPGGPKNPPKENTNNFNNIVWKRRAYIIFLLDEENWKLHKKNSKYPAILFNQDKGSSPNYSFFDAKDVVIRITDANGTDTRTAVYMINYMKADELGTDLGDEHVKYVFDIYARASFANPDSRKLTVVLDPPGGNEGPADPP